MNRREFITTIAGAVVLPRWSWADDLPTDIRITRVVLFDLPSRRAKFVGKNSHLDDHGDKGNDRMVRLYTSAGLDGIGPCRAKEPALRELLGKDPFSFHRAGERRMVSPLERSTTALWDLAGKVLKKPVHDLLGGGGPQRVAVYDGSVYMQDLLARYADTWRDQLRKELDAGLKSGHTAFKIKIGRGYKWMEREAGYARDLEVLKLIRAHVGPKITLMVDANVGYDLARTKRLLDDLPDFNFAFLEQMFRRNVEQYLELKEFIASRRLQVLIAEGESDNRVEAFTPFIEKKAVDILQGDMVAFGFEGVAAYAAAGRPQGIRVAPHNWGSNVGYYMQLQIGRALPNFYAAEQDPLTSDVLIAEGYDRKDGSTTVPDEPGLSLKLSEPQFAKLQPLVDLKA